MILCPVFAGPSNPMSLVYQKLAGATKMSFWDIFLSLGITFVLENSLDFVMYCNCEKNTEKQRL